MFISVQTFYNNKYQAVMMTLTMV